MKLGLVLALFSATLLAGTANAADKRWDGADDLPVNPLACAAGEASAAPAAKPYDGGQPTGAPDKAGKPITLVDVPKLIGIGYELDVIATVVLGGTSIFGGVGTIWGTVVGLAMIQLLKDGLALTGVKGDATIVVIGTVLILSTLVASSLQRRRDGV